MSLDQTSRTGQAGQPLSPEALRASYDRLTAEEDPPLAIVDAGAFDRNAASLTRRAAGRPIRVATKSLRCRALIERALARPGFRGVMCYSLPEALWLNAAGTSDDLLVAYPTVNAAALRALAADEAARANVTIMVDSADHLDVVDRALGDGHPEIRVCLELDVSWRPLAGRPQVHIGTRRSPLFTARQAADVAALIHPRAGLGLGGGTLFDPYTRFTPEPALLFALPVVRRPGPGLATLFAGGYVASGPGTKDRLPRPYLPPGLTLTVVEGAGEVQTPVRGAAAGRLRTGDRVWLRHAKAGELAERFPVSHLIAGDTCTRG